MVKFLEVFYVVSGGVILFYFRLVFGFVVLLFIRGY